jgi:hypothetical protein
LQFRDPLPIRGTVGGIGLALAGGYKKFSWLLMRVIQRLGFDDRFGDHRNRSGRLAATSATAAVMLGVGTGIPRQSPPGMCYSRTTTSSISRLNRNPHWIKPSDRISDQQKLQLVLDVGADFDGGYFLMLAPPTDSEGSEQHD